MLQPQQQFLIDGTAGGRFADDVAALQNVADQVTRRRIFGALRTLLDFAQFADIVQDGAGHDQALVEPRLHFGIVVVVLVG